MLHHTPDDAVRPSRQIRRHPLIAALPALFVATTSLTAFTARAAEQAAPAASDAVQLHTVVVSGSRVAHDSFDLPAAIDVVDREQIVDGQARINASEALAAVPGVVVLNRQNYAQDLQLSSRGFGARSAFGVRGMRLIADGIPASMPDGQGQLATFNLDQAERMEVLRGPMSAVYGNHAGGVIQLFTRDGQGAPTVEGGLTVGSYGLHRVDVNAQGEKNGVGYVLDSSQMHTDGYRDHSAATREQSMAKLTMKPDDDSKLTLVANSMNQRSSQDPLGLDWASYLANPKGVASSAIAYNTRKSIQHMQGGVNYERRLGEDTFQISVYSGTRQVTQYQSTPASTQSSAKNSGGVVAFDRAFQGINARYTHVNELAGGRLATTFGMDIEQSRDNRQGYENFLGTAANPIALGVMGKLRRQETDKVSTFDQYVQSEWQKGQWVLSAGLRHSDIKFDVADGYLSNGNDSGSVSYQRTTPTIGALYKINPVWNVYASAARGFETPTLNELFYSGSGNGFNFGLQPATSRHLEVGTKALLANNTRMNVAVFDIQTQNELVVDVSSNGRTSYKNAPGTSRKGLELMLDTAWSSAWSSKLALTYLNAIYDQTFVSGSGTSATTIQSGNRLPGVASTTVYGELAWKNPANGVGAALEMIHRSKMYVEDTNQEQAAPSFTIANLRVTHEQRVGAWLIKEFARLDNLTDKQYVGSVIVADSNKRFYESAPGRNWMVGVNARYQF